MAHLRATSPYFSLISLSPASRKFANEIQYPASYSGDSAGGFPTRSIVTDPPITNSSRNLRAFSTSVTLNPVFFAMAPSGVFKVYREWRRQYFGSVKLEPYMSHLPPRSDNTQLSAMCDKCIENSGRNACQEVRLRAFF